MARDWSIDEVRAAVADYFAMLRAELDGQDYSKTRHREALQPLLDGRSAPSVEFKHGNISAVLIGMGLPYVRGYKPRGNYQELLADGVEEHLDANPGLLVRLAASKVIDPPAAPPVAAALRAAEVFVPPPDRVIVPREPAAPWLSKRGRRIDFVRRDAENRRLGELGERFAVDVERRRLAAAGRDDLAARVEWVSQTRGDGLGFDVLSFEEADGAERFVEVKTTGLGEYQPFYVTANEVRCSQAMAASYHLYRVFDFARAPRVYQLRGDLTATCRLEAMQYLARL